MFEILNVARYSFSEANVRGQIAISEAPNKMQFVIASNNNIFCSANTAPAFKRRFSLVRQSISSFYLITQKTLLLFCLCHKRA